MPKLPGLPSSFWKAKLATKITPKDALANKIANLEERISNAENPALIEKLEKILASLEKKHDAFGAGAVIVRGGKIMPNEIDTIFDDVFAGKRTEKGPYKPERGEEAIFAAPKKGLLDYLAPLLPFYRQFTGETPWQDPETAMEAISWGMGGLMRGPGMVKAALPKGPSAITTALEAIFSKFGKSTGKVPAVIEKGPLPAAIERGFTRKAGETVETAGRVSRIPKELGTTEPKQLPQYAGPTARQTIKRPQIGKDPIDVLLERAGIPQPSAPQTWRERTFPGTIKRAQDVIEDLMRESLRAKGMID